MASLEIDKLENCGCRDVSMSPCDICRGLLIIIRTVYQVLDVVVVVGTAIRKNRASFTRPLLYPKCVLLPSIPTDSTKRYSPTWQVFV